MTAPTVPQEGIVLDGVVLDVPGRDDGGCLDVVVPAGRTLAVTGPSGTGKTTLLAVLAGLAAARRGTVTWRGRPVAVGDDVHRRGVGYVQQGHGLVATLSALENVAVPLLVSDRRREAWSRARAALEEVGLGEQADQLTDRLSGGQQQRVAVARALATRPALVLADEPTSELDAVHRGLVLDLLDRAVAEHGVTLVVATHDPEVAARCDQQLALT